MQKFFLVLLQNMSGAGAMIGELCSLRYPIPWILSKAEPHGVVSEHWFHGRPDTLLAISEYGRALRLSPAWLKEATR